MGGRAKKDLFFFPLLDHKKLIFFRQKFIRSLAQPRANIHRRGAFRLMRDEHEKKYKWGTEPRKIYFSFPRRAIKI